MICKTLHVLPTEERFQKLTPHNIIWLVSNIANDTEIENRVFRNLPGNKGVSEFDADTFEGMEQAGQMLDKLAGMTEKALALQEEYGG